MVMNLLRLKDVICFNHRFDHRALLFAALALAGFAMLPMAQAVVPPPDGDYPGGNTAEGQSALLSLTTGSFNTALGFVSLESISSGNFNTATGAGTLLLNTADNNTATGAGALLSNATGDGNTANGAFALFTNTAGAENTATGFNALFGNTTGNNNTANGSNALLSNNTGGSNTANGESALFFNITGSSNTATGADALFSNNTGEENTANGVQALLGNTTGSRNSAFGSGALASNTTAIQNTASGVNALANNLTGDNNTANGFDALQHNTNGQQNTAIGDLSLVNNSSGDRNIALGHFAGSGVTTADEVICIGSPGANVSMSCFIGHIRGVTTANADAIPVLVDSDGQLGTTSSARRFKKEIKPMDKASEALLALKPVTFHYKSDSTNTPQYGLVAEEVAKVNPDLIVRDKNGEIYTVRYDQVNAMLLNEFLKEHRKNEEQEATIAQLKSVVEKQKATNARQQKRIEALAAGLEKLNVKLGVGESALQTVLNNQ
jgi:uncharacterized coiled-coil protein SlyX